MDVFLTGFVKKPLVATSLLIIVIMCLPLGETAPAQHKRRHNRNHEIERIQNHEVEHINLNKVPLKIKDDTLSNDQLLKGFQNRPMRVHSKTKLKPRTHYKKQAVYKSAIKTIRAKLSNLKHYFISRRHEYPLLHEFRANPSWLPKVNFISIHEKTKDTALRLRDRFHLVIPKMYQNLNEYRLIFEYIREVTIHHSDDTKEELVRRKNFINASLNDLTSLIVTLSDALISVKIEPKFNSTKVNFKHLRSQVDGTGLQIQDKIVLASYNNTMEKWKRELRCWIPARDKSRICRNYDETLLEKKRKLDKRKIV